MISILGKILSPLFNFFKKKWADHRANIQSVIILSREVKELTSQVELLSERVVGELSFAKTITAHDKKIEVLEGSVGDIKYSMSNVQKTVDTLFNIFDRQFGRTGKKQDERYLKIDRRCRD